MTAPRCFISYSWTNPEHQDWVLRLATQLRESGVDAILDKWDLREGNDAIAFMERMVTDPTVTKVIMVLNRSYAEKADKREGGVGTESQIISAEVYNRLDQNKFVGVLSELDDEGHPFRPAYYRSRIYIDLSSDEIYGSNFEQLIRWIFDKPLHVKPSLGKTPEFLQESAVDLGTSSRARRAREQARNRSIGAAGALADYFDVLTTNLERFRIAEHVGEFDDAVVASIEQSLPFRNEYIEVVLVVARYWHADYQAPMHKLLEGLLRYLYRPPAATQWSDDRADNFSFICHEMFLYLCAAFIGEQRFIELNELLTQPLYLGDYAPDRTKPIESYVSFREYLRSLERRRDRLKLNRASLRADYLEKRSHTGGISFSALMQADFILFLRSTVKWAASQSWNDLWWPETLVYAERHRGPFEVFARSTSSRYLENVLPLVGVTKLEDLINAVNLAIKADNLPKWSYHRLEVGELMNASALASQP
jgi:hypothetical protein